MKITVNGGTVTGAVRVAGGAQIGPMRVNELSTAHFQFLPNTAPARGDTLIAYGQDGVTPIFGGLVRRRTARSIRQASAVMFVDVDVDDWWVYLDTSLPTSREYTAPVTLKTALIDLVADCGLNFAGFTVDPAQATGPTLDAFAWANTRASDAVRLLSTWAAASGSSYVARISPTKVIKMAIPASDPAPWTITDAAPHCEEVGWADPDEIRYDKVALWCGPAGPMDYRQTWIQAGGASSWLADIPAANGTTAGYVTVGGVSKTVSVYHDGLGQYEWDWASRTLVRGTDPIPANGTAIVFVYAAASPFLVTAGSGLVVSTASAPAALTLAVGQQTADALLAKLNQAPVSWSFLSHDGGWLPGQGVTVNFAGLGINAVLAIDEVTIDLLTATIWKYRFTASPTVLYQGGASDQWRALGVGASTIAGTVVAPAGVTGGGGTLPPLPAGQIYVGSASNVAAPVPMSGDVHVTAAGATTIQPAVIGNLEVHPAAAIVDSKLATIASPGKVANSATTAISTGAGSMANTIMLRNDIGDCTLSRIWLTDSVVTPYVTSNVGPLVLYGANGVVVVPDGLGLETSYASGFAGSGFALSYNRQRAGAAYLEVDQLTVRGTFNVYELLVHQIRATNGSLFVSSTGRVKAVSLAGGVTYSIDTEGDHGFAVGDLIRAQRFTTAGGGAAVYQTNMIVSSVASATHFGADLQSSTSSPIVGADFVRLGSQSSVARQGSIYLTADDTGAPFIQFSDGVSSFAQWGTVAKIKGRIGNLLGVHDYGTTTYGAWFGAYGGPFIAVDSVNGVRIGYGSTVYTRIDGAGNATFSGTVAIGNVTINTGGIGIAVPSSYSLASAYRFDLPSGSALAGTFMQDSGTGTVALLNMWGGAGRKQSNIIISASGISSYAESAAIQLNTDGTSGVIRFVYGGGGSIDFQQGGNISAGGTVAWGGGAVIPSSSSVARKDISENFSGALACNGAFLVRDAQPIMQVYAYASATNEKYTRWIAATNRLILQLVDDGYTAANDAITFTRSSYGFTGVSRVDNQATWTTVSDAIVKTNIRDLDDAVANMRAVRIRAFDYTGEFGVTAGPGVGPVAQELQAIFPRSVKNIPRARSTAFDGTPEGAIEDVLTFTPDELWMTHIVYSQAIDRDVSALAARVAALEGRV